MAVRSLAATAALVGIAVSTTAACGSFSSDDATSNDAGTSNADGGGGGGGGDGGGAGGDGGGAACPGNAGPPMVRVGAYCIDSTEVTRGQYKEFFTAKGNDTSGQIPACATNTSFEPADWPVSPGSEKKPVIVDWCDAYAYCQWAGKRLCGRIGGGPMEAELTQVKRADRDQWYAACSRGGTRAFPYGDTYEARRCNGEYADGGDGTLDEVASFPGCVGGYDGLFDMSGNVSEWEDACTTDRADAECYARGDAFYEGEDVASCSSFRSHPRLGFTFNVGIRCCSP